MSGPGGVQSVERVIDLLELLAGEPGEVPLARLAAASGLPPSTVHRLMSTLVARGYARRLPSRAFVLGPRLIHLGERSASTLGLLARPHLAGLVDEIGETANLALLDGDRVVYAAQVPSRHSMRMFTEVGRRVRLHCTGVGKVLLAGRPPPRLLPLLRTAAAALAADLSGAAPAPSGGDADGAPTLGEGRRRGSLTGLSSPAPRPG
jgi:IclR family acetate operon transcriptional repressor